MAKKKIVLTEGSERFNMVNNHILAEKGNFFTPEKMLESEINIIIEKIKVLSGTRDLMKNGIIKLVINEKIEAYKDSSESLLKIGNMMKAFKNKLEIK